MIVSRRHVLRIGGLTLAGLATGRARAADGDAVEIEMLGNKEGSKVWFEPIGLLVRPGQMVRWTNRDAGNAHTTTAYHPANDGHPLRVPGAAAPWNSGYLLPDQSFAITLTVPGVYDYFCVPHEHAGMVGRLIVKGDADAILAAAPGIPIAELAEDPFPTVEAILSEGRVSLR